MITAGPGRAAGKRIGHAMHAGSSASSPERDSRVVLRMHRGVGDSGAVQDQFKVGGLGAGKSGLYFCDGNGAVVGLENLND